MMFRKLLTGTVAVAMAASPVVAQATPSDLRSSTPVEDGEELIGTTFMIIGGIVVLGIILILLLDDDDEEEPVSP